MIKCQLIRRYNKLKITYAPNIGLHKYIKQTIADLKREIDNNTITVEDFNSPL